MKPFVGANDGTFTHTLETPLVFQLLISYGMGRMPLWSANRKSPPVGEANCRYEKPGTLLPRFTKTGKSRSVSLRVYPEKEIFRLDPYAAGLTVTVLNCDDAGAQELVVNVCA